MNTAVAIPPAKGVFIDNRWRPAASGRTLPMVAPAEGAVFASIAAGDKADVDLAVAAARKAFETGAWGRLNAVERCPWWRQRRARCSPRSRRGTPLPRPG